MNKKALRKEFYMTVRKSFGRFASIFLIVALGVAFFSGVRASEPDMRISADAFYDESRLMDIRVLSTLGLTDEDVDAIRRIGGVGEVMPSYSQDVLCDTESSQLVVKMMSVPDSVNRITVLEGRMPEKSGECLADTAFIGDTQYKVGDRIEVKSGTEDDIDEQLKRQDYVITGVGSTSYYLSLDRGTSKIGSGELNSFLVIPREDFALSAYTEVYVTVEGAREDTAYSDSYDDRVSGIVDRIEDISDARCQVRYTDIKEEADEKIGEGEEKIADAKRQLSDALKELEDGKKELADAKEELAEGKEKVADGEKTLAEKEKELADGERELADAAMELADARQELVDAEKDLADGREEIDENRKKLDDGLLESMNANEKLKEGRAELEKGKRTLGESEEQLLRGEEQLSAQEQGIAQVKGMLKNDATVSGNEYLAAKISGLTAFFSFAGEAGKLDEAVGAANAAGIPIRISPGASAQEIGGALQTLAGAPGGLKALEGLSQIASSVMDQASDTAAQARRTLDEGRDQLEKGREEIAQKEKELKEGEDKVSQAQFDIREGYEKLEDAEKEWEDGKAEYEDGLEEYEDGLKEYEDGVKELEDGKKKLSDAKQELKDAERELSDGEEKITDGEEKLFEGQKEYDDAEKEADEKLSDAQEKIDDAREKLEELEEPEWYVLDRNYIETYVEYGQDAERIGAIGRVFPVIFFLVAALVSLTTMTRMVEEERTQIGTHKALGYSNFDIAKKYIGYALLASLSGSLLGIVLGQKILPLVIIQAYSILYNNLPAVITPLNPYYSAAATLAAVTCTVGAAVLSCYRELMAVPAVLMRPEAPKAGKRVFLERIGFLWRRLSFTGKAAVRNLIRYKKRFFMTIFGIGGCTALVLVGFGIKDSIVAIGDIQFGQIRTYQAEITVDEDASEEDRDCLEDILTKDERIKSWVYARQTSVDVSAGGEVKSAYLMAPDRTEGFSDFINLRRKKGESITLEDQGAVITEKLSILLDKDVGDTILLKPDDTTQVEVRITGIAENYFMHYVYLSKDAYRKAFGEEPEMNSIFTINTESGTEYETRMGKDYMDLEAVGGIAFTSGTSDRVRNMLKSMDTIIYVLVISAGLLAFIVLYNLNNINITERKRELSTLKVLGFYDIEVSQYILRENVMLTILGSAAGIGMGVFLHRYVMRTVEIDILMFGRNIKPMSYLYSILLTFLFSAVVNAVMHFRLKKIDMIESLKSVE